MKLKKIGLALGLLLAANAASAVSLNTVMNSVAPDNGNFMFTSWTATGSYTFQLALKLNDLIGADNTDADMTGNDTNTLIRPNTTATGSYDVLLTGLNGSAYTGVGSYWNLVAADTDQRYRAVYTQKTGSTYNAALMDNTKVANIGDAYNGFVGNLIAYSSDFSNIPASDPAYGNGSGWGSSLGSNINFTAQTYGNTSNLYAAWQNSSQEPGLAGVASLGYVAFTHVVGSDTYLTIQAVPEADTSGMMIAGLGLMGFIARRRRNTQA